MNLTKKKKKGFTLIELMAVIAIIAILAAVLVPTVTGYINRAKKTAVVTQVRNVVSAVETYNATADNPIDTGKNQDASKTVKVGEIPNLVGDDLLSAKSINKLGTMTIDVAYEINENQNAVKDINLDKKGIFASYGTTSGDNTQKPENNPQKPEGGQ